jgi:5-methylcytosine-specific restriction protein A
MPRRAQRPCKTAGCAELVAADTGYCTAHQKCKPGENRLTAWRRGYDGAWQRFRLMFLRKNPLCDDCLKTERVEPATEVHHLLKVADHPELKLVESNCMALCKSCHSVRTNRGE